MSSKYCLGLYEHMQNEGHILRIRQYGETDDLGIGYDDENTNEYEINRLKPELRRMVKYLNGGMFPDNKMYMTISADGISATTREQYEYGRTLKIIKDY